MTKEETVMCRTYFFSFLCFGCIFACSCSDRRGNTSAVRPTQTDHQVKFKDELAVSLRPKPNAAGIVIELSYGARSERLPQIRKLTVTKFEQGKPVSTCSIVSHDENGQALSSWQVGSPREGFSVVGNCPSMFAGEFEVTAFDFVMTSYIRFSIDSDQVVKVLEPEDIFGGHVKTQQHD